jgi:hypothetical protein
MTLRLRMPLRFLRGSGAALGLTVLAIACGVALVAAIDLASRAVVSAFVEVIDTLAGRVALQVTAGEGGLLPEATVDRVAAVPGVEHAIPLVEALAFTTGGPAEPLLVRGRCHDEHGRGRAPDRSDRLDRVDRRRARDRVGRGGAVRPGCHGQGDRPGA